MEGAHNCWGVVAPLSWFPPCWGGADGSKDCRMEYQRRQFLVLFGDFSARIGESDQLQDNVGRPLHSPGKVNVVFIGIDPDHPVSLSQGVCVA